VHHRPLTTATTAEAAPAALTESASPTGPPPQGLRASAEPRGEEKSPPPDRCPPTSHEGGATNSSAHPARLEPEGSGRSSYMESRSILIVPESGAPCQLGIGRFTVVRALQASRVTGSTCGSSAFTRFLPKTAFPVGSYESSVLGLGLRGLVAAALVCPLSELVGESVTEVLEGVVPCGGTRSEVSARGAGARGAIRAEPTLSTGGLVQGRRMDHEAPVLPAEGGVRFGVYTSLMTTQVVVRIPAGAVGR
jgi:hypothetical protein